MRLLALLLLAFPAFAADSWVIGEELTHELSVCVSKESAMAVIDADAQGGREAMAVLFNAKDDCMTIPVRNATVGKVVHHVKIKRGEAEKTASAIEIVKDGKVVAYFLSTVPVVARLEVEPKRGSNS